MPEAHWHDVAEVSPHAFAGIAEQGQAQWLAMVHM